MNGHLNFEKVEDDEHDGSRMSFTSTGSLDGNGMGCLKLILKVVFLYGPPFVAFPLLE